MPRRARAISGVKVYTLAEARARGVVVSERTMRADAKAGRLPIIRGPRNQILITAETLDEYVRRRHNGDLTAKELAQSAGVTLRTVRQWKADGLLPFVEMSPRRIVFPWSDERLRLVAEARGRPSTVAKRRMTLARLVTIREAAAYLQRSPDWVWARLAKPLPVNANGSPIKRLLRTKWRGRQRLLPREDVRALAADLAREDRKNGEVTSGAKPKKSA